MDTDKYKNRKQCFHERKTLLCYLCTYKLLNTITHEKELCLRYVYRIGMRGAFAPLLPHQNSLCPLSQLHQCPTGSNATQRQSGRRAGRLRKRIPADGRRFTQGLRFAIDYDRDFARQSAVANARAQMASDIQALVTNVFKNYRATTTKNNVSTSEADRQQDIISIAEEVISRTTITCSKRYRLSDGRYECAVCVSMVQSASEDIEKAVLSEDAKLGVRFDAEQFRKSYQEELERYRQQKQSQL